MSMRTVLITAVVVVAVLVGAKCLGVIMWLILPSPVSALEEAVSLDDIEKVTLLLDEGADPNMKFPLLESYPLYRAISGDDVEMVKLLLERGADVNGLCPADGKPLNPYDSPLHNACGKDYRDIVEVLLRHGADVNLT